MEEAQKYREQFLDVVGEIEVKLTLILEDWDRYLIDTGDLDDLYRMVHSLKSGAAFLDLTEIQESAHSVEDCIELYRKEGESGDELKQLLSTLLVFLNFPRVDQTLGHNDFSPRELTLMEEVKLRGETLYRLSCRIDPAEPMKKARAFLIQNNLELSFNVIKTIPSLNEESDFSLFTLFLSTKEKRDALRRAIDVDRISEIRIEPFIPGEEPIERSEESLVFQQNTYRHPVTLEKDRLDEIQIYLDELKESLDKKDSQSRSILSGIDRVLKTVLNEPLSTLATGVDLYTRKMGESMGKSVTFLFEGTDFLLSKGQIQPLLEIFQQLVRNSLTHGIVAEGEITLRGTVEGGKKILTYCDNGQGLDEALIRQKSLNNEGDLLSIICQSGFSTSQNVDTNEGRGIGMNLVLHNIKSLGGELSLDAPECGGVSFTIDLPVEDILPILQYRLGTEIVSLPQSFVQEELELNRRNLKKNRKNQFFYLHKDEYIPLYEMDQPTLSLSKIRQAGFVILVSYLNNTYALLADELLLERVVPREELENLTYLHPRELGAKKAQ